MTKPITTEEFIERAKSVHGDRYDYSLVEYKNSDTKVKIICKEHGVFEQTPYYHLRSKTGCQKCHLTHHNKSHSTKLTTKNFIARAKEIHGDVYDYSQTKYTHSHNNVTIICKDHGTFKQLPSTHLNGSGCKQCVYNNNTLTTKEFIEKSKVVHGDRYDYTLVDYKKAQYFVTIICKDHGKFIQRAGDHMNNGRGCPQCGIDSMKQIQSSTTEEFIEKATSVHGDKYDYSLVKYVNNKTKVKIICKDHGVFKQKPNNHLNFQGCKNCSNAGVSKAEQEIFDYIKSIYSGPMLQSDRNIISPLELDIVLPELKIAIEYNGLYWHSVEQGKDKWYHANKMKTCNDVGYRLLHIMEDEWNFKQDIVKKKLRHILGLSDDSRIFARKCEIRSLDDNNMISEFFNQNHIQGCNKVTIAYGLFYNDVLCAAMAFTKRSETVYELSRYATSNHVIGGFSKLLRQFTSNNNWTEIISFADLRWHEGDAYKKAGFIIEKTIAPDYQYIVELRRVHKFNFRHTTGLRKLATYNPDLSERENMELAGISRIYDCGKIKFLLLMKNPKNH